MINILKKIRKEQSIKMEKLNPKELKQLMGGQQTNGDRKSGSVVASDY